MLLQDTPESSIDTKVSPSAVTGPPSVSAKPFAAADEGATLPVFMGPTAPAIMEPAVSSKTAAFMGVGATKDSTSNAAPVGGAPVQVDSTKPGIFTGACETDPQIPSRI